MENYKPGQMPGARSRGSPLTLLTLGVQLNPPNEEISTEKRPHGPGKVTNSPRQLSSSLTRAEGRGPRAEGG